MDQRTPDWLLEHVGRLPAMLSYLLNGHLTLFCVLSGVLLNLVCMYVFIRFRHGSTPVIQCYLITLTAWQTALLCNAFLLYCFPTLWYGHVVSRGEYVRVYPYVYALANTTHTGSVWIVLTLTVDRFLALCKPLTHPTIGKRSRVKKLMVFVSILAMLFSVPRIFEVTTVMSCLQKEDNCAPQVVRTDLPKDRLYWTIYHIILGTAFVTLGPCLLLFGLTLRISIALRRATRRRKSLCQVMNEGTCRQEFSNKDHRANVMLVLVIAKFLVSDILPTVVDVLEHLVGNHAFMSSSTATVFVDFSNFLLVLNCSTNFWVFFFWGKRFRRYCFCLLSNSCLAPWLSKWISKESQVTSFLALNQATCTTKLRNPASLSDFSRKRNSFSPGDLENKINTSLTQHQLFPAGEFGIPRTQRARSYAAVEGCVERRKFF
uniref:G_PROTEIN_RECEP_F1_2 domain-containing protein n=2 Tax=Bursaphelenchus xylophilus TaxID=6326 RepID=A0A1I7SMA1_BURXY